MKPIKCDCGTLFGIEHSDGTLVIKHRDLYRKITGSVQGPCRRCGNEVKWSNDAGNPRT